MSAIEWRAPAPIWNRDLISSPAALRPRLVACSGDSFLDSFLELMQGKTPGKTPRAMADALLPLAGTQKLFQPAHGRYYLLVGSLVCRQVGLPDRAVASAAGERVSFVIRRLQRSAQGALTGGEEAWVDDGPQRGWHLVDRPAQPYQDEERLPMHPVETCASYAKGENPFACAFGLAECGRRSVYYGYVPVGNRGKYAERIPINSGADPAAQFRAFVDSVVASGEPGHDPRMDEVDSRVISPWLSMYADPVSLVDHSPAPPDGSAPLEPFSLYLLLDMADVLRRNLPSLYTALGTDGGGIASGSQRRALFDRLRTITTVEKNASGKSLTDILDQLRDNGLLALVQDGADESSVSDATYQDYASKYMLKGASNTSKGFLLPNGQLHQLFSAALAEEKAERGESWLPPPTEERLGLLRDQVVPLDTGPEPSYVLRMIYEHAPCCPVVSAPSGPVSLAPFYDPDAPARHIRIEAPSIKPRDLRKYKRGVGIAMSPELRDVMNRVHKGMLDDEGLASGAGWQLGMICSFSLQIIFLVAIIVMFIFLIAFNLIFWWLPFLKICFPIPVKGK